MPCLAAVDTVETGDSPENLLKRPRYGQVRQKALASPF